VECIRNAQDLTGSCCTSFSWDTYGHNLSQAAILENEVILNAKEIQFPNRPQVSNEAKLFIRRYLT
jgi:hypothetical protein